MSAPVLWILLPLLASGGLWFLQRRQNLTAALAAGLCLLLSLFAWALPIGEFIHLGPLNFRIDSTLLIAGRSLIIEQTSQPLLILFYAMAAFWFVGVPAARGHTLLVPVGLASIALLVAALAVQPVLYAALLIEGAVLLSVPMLVRPGQAPGRGILRYLIFQSLAMPLFIIGGWALAGAAANPTDTNLTTLTAGFLGLSFAFWLATFPFYTWAPLLSGEAQPFAGGFVFLFLPSAVLLLGLNILGGYGWLRGASLLYDVLRLSGGLMVVTAGVWAAFQRDLGRLFGYAFIIQTGFSLLALSLNNRLGDEIFVMMFLPRVIALGLWTLTASIFRQNAPSLQFSDLEHFAEKLPFASGGLVFAFFSLAGLPLLAEFPIRQVLLQEISVQHPIAALGVLIGGVGLLFSAFRFLVVITGGNVSPRLLRNRQGKESRFQVILIIGGIVGLLVVGVFPRLFFPLMVGLLEVFKNLP
jgi:NADH-quinone oxidoreductase subunit N